MDKIEFNQRFLLELNRYGQTLNYLETGPQYHPLLRQVLLWEIKQNIKQDGWPIAMKRWGKFIA